MPTGAQADDLRAQLAVHEALRSGEVRTFPATSLLGLAEALVKARVAGGWTQRRLAEELGVAEQQVQLDEATGCAWASLARLDDVASALGVIVTETVTLDAGGSLRASDDDGRWVFGDERGEIVGVAGQHDRVSAADGQGGHDGAGCRDRGCPTGSCS